MLNNKIPIDLFFAIATLGPDHLRFQIILIEKINLRVIIWVL